MRIKLNSKRFASGTIYLSTEHSSSSVTFQGKLEWSSTSNGAVANTSDVSVTLYARKQNSSQATSNSGWSGSITIDGTKTSKTTGSLSIKNSWVKIMSASKTVSHNSDGTKSITLAGSIKGPSGTTLANITSSGSGTATLDTILRQSALSSVTMTIANNGTITIKPNGTKYVSTYYDRLYISDSSGDLLYIDGITFGTTYTLSSSQQTTIFNSIGNATSKTFASYVLTKTASGGTSLGTSSSVNVQATLPTYSLSFSSSSISDTNTSISTYKKSSSTYIANLSSPQITFSAVSSTGSTYGNSIYYTYNNNTITSPYSISNWNGSEIVVSATDKRVTSSVTLLSSSNIVPYTTPSIRSFSMERQSPTSDTANIELVVIYYDPSTVLQNLKSLAIAFTCVEGSTTYTLSTSDFTLSSKSGTTTITATYKATLSGLDYKKSCTYGITFTDYLGQSVPMTDQKLSPGIPVWNAYADGDDSIFKVNGNTILKGTLTYKGYDIIDLIYPVGSIFISANNVNPQTYLGGTWESFGSGRTLVGVDSSDTDFNSSEKTGGSKEIQAHTHGAGTYNVSADFYVRHGSTSGTSTVASGTNTTITTGAYSSTWGNGFATDTYEHKPDKVGINANVTGASASYGNGSSGNLQPYITVYMFKRTA